MLTNYYYVHVFLCCTFLKLLSMNQKQFDKTLKHLKDAPCFSFIASKSD